MNSLNILKNIYKPYRYTICGKTTIITTLNGIFVIKPSDYNVVELFNYLTSRGFNNYPRIVDDSRKGVLVYEYIDEIKMPIEQKGLDLATTVANLHHKTTHFKEVSSDRYKTIYDNIKSNINYFKEYYNQFYNRFFKEIYHSPSHYLFLINFSKLDSLLDFCSHELDEWYDLIKNKNTQRVTIIHNNLSLNHYIKNNNNDYLISWDKAKTDTPVLDMVKFYQNNYFDINFNKILDNYLSQYPWQEDEKKLFYILISLPPKIEFDKQTEFNNTKHIKNIFDYIFKTELLVGPYYSKEKKEE